MATKKKGTKKPQRMKDRTRTPLVKVGALWIKTGSKGKFLSGTVDVDDRNSITLLVFPNGYKEDAKHPDYVIYAPAADDSTPEDKKPRVDEFAFPGGEQIGDQSPTREPGDEPFE